MLFSKLIAIMAFVFLASQCAPVQKQQNVSISSGQVRLVGLGDTVVRIERTRDLKNAFGAADIFGRKTYEGYSELRYAGILDDGSILMYRQDLRVETDEDTITRSGIGVATTQSTGNVSIHGSTAVGSSTSTTVISQPRTANTVAIPSGAMEIILPPDTRRFPFAGQIVEVLQADAVSMRYRVLLQ